MSKKLAHKNSSNPKTLEFHQIGNRESNESKSSESNQKVLIISTPIKLKDGTVNMEQRTIPLRIDNSQLTITATGNKNKIVSLKRSIEPPTPLALPINQLNKKSPTFVKNEVGQVMGKLIPLGKFSNIAKKSSNRTISTDPSPPATSKTIKNENLTLSVAKARVNKVVKLEEGKIVNSSKKKKKIIPNSSSKTKANKTVTAPPSEIFPKVKNLQNQLITITDAKPKKRVHLVLRGYQNVASIGQTGTKIKLIPLDHFKMVSKSNSPETQSSNSIISQPKIVDIRSCSMDEMDGSEKANPSSDKLNCKYEKEDFDIDDIFEKDPLDIGEMLSVETEEIVPDSLDKSSLKNDVGLKKEPELAQQNHAINKPDSIRTVSESGRVNSSKILTLAKGGMSIELKYDNKVKTQSIWAKKTQVLLKNSTIGSKPSETVIANAQKLELDDSIPVEKVEEEMEVRKNDVNCADDLYKRFGINKNNVTPTETAMLSYICNLKKKLYQSQKSRVQAITALQPREYLGNNNLSNIQKRFVESQLRNSGRMNRKQRFIKPDLIMAEDILKATGPRGYSNLRRLFSLPDMGAVVKGISKT